MSVKICVVGSINYDLVVKGARIPRPGETLIGNKFITAPGGKGANQAVAAARLGGEVSMVGRVGVDAFGNELRANLKANHVNTENVWQTPGVATGVALIMVDESGQNSILVAPGSNMTLTKADIRQAEQAITSADILLLQLEVPMEVVVEAARVGHQHGVKVVLNPAPARLLPEELPQWVDIIIPNEYEAQVLTNHPGSSSESGQLDDLLLGLGVKQVIITLGSQGARIISREKKVLKAPFQINAVDTTAAGDAFVGGFSVALAEGADIEDAVVWGNAAGALAATRMGAQPSLPTRDEVDYLIKNNS
jgi:ribokinase